MSLTAPCSNLFGKFYLGAFGGGGKSDSTHVTQRGFAFNNPDPRLALSVKAQGHSGHFASGMVGGHIGYEVPTKICLLPSFEFEGFYLCAFGGKKTSFLFNPTLAVHAFVDTLPTRSVSFFGNVYLAFKIPHAKWLQPYVAGGIGGAIMWISHAHSEQDSPEEPGVNHFNSKPSASDSTLTAQFKTGLRFILNRHWRLFAEYRYLYQGSTTYMFGFTQYPQLGHAPTSNWILDLGTLHYNIGSAGLEYRF